MKIFLALLLCMFVADQWISCEASRKMFMEQMEGEANRGFLPVPKKLLSEAIDETNGMETELILPDESDNDEKPEIMIEKKKKRVKQQKDPLLEALEEQTSEEKKHEGDESTLSEIGTDDLLLEESNQEKSVREKRKKEKKTLNAEESSMKDNSSSELTGGKWQQDDKRGKKSKKEKIVEDEEFSVIPDTLTNTEKGEGVQNFLAKGSAADIADMEMDTSTGHFPSQSGEEQYKSNIVKEGKQEEQTVVMLKKHKASIEEEATKQYNDDGPRSEKKIKMEQVEVSVKAENVSEGSSSRASDGENPKIRKDKVEESATSEKVKRGSKSKILGSTGEATVEEITDEETPADLIEREMQGEVEDLVANASDSEEEGGGGKEKYLKKSKKSKKPKADVLQGDNSESKSFNDIDEKGTKIKEKKKKSSHSELQKGLDVISAEVGESSDLQSKQVDMEGMGKLKVKKKTKAKSDKSKNEGNSSKKSEKNSEESQKEQKSSEKAKETSSKNTVNEEEKDKEEPYKKAKKAAKKSRGEETKRSDKHTTVADAAKSGEGQGTQEWKKLKVTDSNTGKDIKGIEKEKVDAEEKISIGGEGDPQTMEKQEEKLEMEVQGIAKESKRKAEGSNGVPNLVKSSIEGTDEEEDEYSDFMQDFSDLSTKFQDTALKVADHLGPNIQKLTDTSKTYFNKANQQITKSFSPLVGKQFAPFLASLISYGLLLVPLAVVIMLFEHIRALLSLQKVLLFVNIYLAAYFATLLLATFIMGEPMNFFYRSSASGYVHLQLLQALGYVIYLILQTVDLVSAFTSEAWTVKITVVLQWFVAFMIGFHYYVTVFHRAMALKGPHTNWKIYGTYSTAFLVLCLFARIKRAKKGYLQLGQYDTDKKH